MNTTVLIVDDDTSCRQELVNALHPAHFTTCEATTCEEAMKQLKEKSFDCVLLDYVLPDKDGLSFLKEVRDAGITTPIVVITGYGDELLVASMLKSGANDYIPKDKMTTALLVNAMTNVVQQHQVVEAAEARRQEVLGQLRELKREAENRLENEF